MILMKTIILYYVTYFDYVMDTAEISLTISLISVVFDEIIWDL